jgi:hypothetical protein
MVPPESPGASQFNPTAPSTTLNTLSMQAAPIYVVTMTFVMIKGSGLAPDESNVIRVQDTYASRMKGLKLSSVCQAIFAK